MKRLEYLIVTCFVILFSTMNVKAQYENLVNETTKLLSKPLNEKEAVIWYLGQDGFAVKTKNHILIFDPYNVGMEHSGLISSDASLTTGVVNMNELRNLDIVVFISTLGGDHYGTGIWLWQQFASNVTYVFGWDPVIGIPFHDYIYLKPREGMNINGMQVSTIQATDAGVSFFVNVDGLNIVFGGANAVYEPKMKEEFTKEIDYLADIKGQCDIAFLEFQFGKGEKRSQMADGIWYVNQKLAPKVIFPMGAINSDLPFRSKPDPVTYEYLIKELIKEAPSAEIGSKIVETEKRGKVFIYSDGKIVR